MQARWLILALALCAILVVDGTASAQQPIVVRVQPSGWLGFSYTPLRDADGPRIVVDTVIPESPAARAGMQKADTIVNVNGLRATPQLMASLASALQPGDEVELGIRRGGAARTLKVAAAERPEGFSMMRGDIIAFEPDSLRRVLRGVFDSVRVRVDSLTLPRLYIRRGGDAGEFIFGHGEALDTLHFDADSMHTAFRFFGDSMRIAFDSMFTRIARPDIHIEILGDSIVVRDSAGVRRIVPRGEGLFFGDSDFRFDAPMRGFTRLGMNAVAGMVLDELGPGLGRYFGTESGLLVLDVADETPAARAGLREGDVIRRADGREVARVRDLRRAVNDAGDEDLTLGVLRDRREIELVLKHER